MTAKQFFKSNVFKCLISLLCVLLVSGVFLAIANGFLEVTEEEMFKRQFNKQVSAVYDGRTVTPEAADISGQNTAVGSSTIQKVWLIKEENDYLVQAEGKGGYNGSLTIWTIIKMDTSLKAITGIRAVSIYAYPDGELVGNISVANLNLFAQDYKDGIIYNYGDKTDPSYVQTNSSYSFSAICNAVNGSIEFINAFAGGIVKEDPFEGFLYREFVNTDKDTGYELNADGDVVFTVRTKANAPAGYFTVEIVVGTDGLIKKYTVKRYGSEDSHGEDKTEEEYNEIVDKMILTYMGKDLKYFTDKLGEDMAYPGDNSDKFEETGASRSNYLCMYAGAFATANYQKALDKLTTDGGETDE